MRMVDDHVSRICAASVGGGGEVAHRRRSFQALSAQVGLVLETLLIFCNGSRCVPRG